MASVNPNPSMTNQPQHNLDRAYGTSSKPRSNLGPAPIAIDTESTSGQAHDSSLLSHLAAPTSGRFHEELDLSQRGSLITDAPVIRSNSVMIQRDTLSSSRGGTLKKKGSLRRASSLKRSSSRRSLRAGSVRSLVLQSGGNIDEMHSAFYSPVPTSGNPTEILANRFQAWRKVLKDLITYFREIQASHDHKAKGLLKVLNVINNTTTPQLFLQSGGVDDALQVLRAFHKSAVTEATKSKDIENDVILALIGLRSDLQQKIKEIKSLSGDFKNSVEKEMEGTRRAVNELQDGLGLSDTDPSQITGKKDPYLLRLAADRQIERQIDEENYLHQAYLNLEASGRELEAIVVGEIQKSYNAYAGILKREADLAYATVDDLRIGPIAMPRDHEWNHFVQHDEHLVNPKILMRQPQNIQYPGRDNELAQEIRAGLLERKSKYLKSYTAGWYVLSPTHLHEFKSADKTQAPIMSLYLPEQKLGSHSSEGSSSNKFMLKGRQTGAMHRGHSWIFRCESHETMLSWYMALKNLTEKSPQERSAFVRQHARSFSSTSQRAASIGSSDGIMDEDDEEPFSTVNSAIVPQGPKQDSLPRRPHPGGRFPSSDLHVEILSQRGLYIPLSTSSGSSSAGDVPDQGVAVAAALARIDIGSSCSNGEPSLTHATVANQKAEEDGVKSCVYRKIATQNDKVSQETSRTRKTTVAMMAVPKENNSSEQYYDAKFADVQRPQNHVSTQSTNSAAPSSSSPKPASLAAHEGATLVASNTTASPELVSYGHHDHIRDGVVTNAYLGSPSKRIVPDPYKTTTFRSCTQERFRTLLVSGQTDDILCSVSNLHVPGEWDQKE